MSVQNTLSMVKAYCVANSGDEREWTHNGTHYHWNLGRDSSPGKDVNGVVRKRVGKDWVLAGSLKISAQGKILRFTGMGKKIQKQFVLTPITISSVTETV